MLNATGFQFAFDDELNLAHSLSLSLTHSNRVSLALTLSLSQALALSPVNVLHLLHRYLHSSKSRELAAIYCSKECDCWMQIVLCCWRQT